MNTPLPPVDPINDTLLFSSGALLLSTGVPRPALRCQAKSLGNKGRMRSWAVVTVLWFTVLGVGVSFWYAHAPLAPAKPVASFNVAPSPALVAKIAEPPEVGAHDTSVAFVCSPAEAARVAVADRKLTFLLHVSGDFEDSEFT